MSVPISLLKKGRKVQQVLEGAREIFLRDGFEGASVDDIAKAANVSKATLYSYFSDKRQLFAEVVTTECDRMSSNIVAQLDDSLPIRDRLLLAAKGAALLLLSDFSQRMFRICLAERDRFPELCEAYYKCGPLNGHHQITLQFQKAVEAGELKIDDMETAAWQFAELCKARVFVLANFGVQTEFSDAEIDTIATAAVDTFLARYGA